MVDYLYNTEFLLCRFKINCIHTLALKSDIVNTVGVRYRRLPIFAKTKFHIDQMNVKLEHLGLLAL